jgi:hypothetical protein
MVSSAVVSGFIVSAPGAVVLCLRFSLIADDTGIIRTSDLKKL